MVDETKKEIDANEERNSTEISINAKGLWSGKIKVYDSEIEESYKKAMIKAGDMDREIRRRNGL